MSTYNLSITAGETRIIEVALTDAPVQAHGFVPCNASGNIYYQVEASGAGTMHIWLDVYGYII